MKSPGDKLPDAPPFQQQGIELILKTLRESAEPVHIVSFGSARAIAAAYNREPALFRTKLARLHLCAGGSSPPAPNYIEWNVALDPLAIVCLLRSDLPIALYPDAANNAGDKGYGVFSPAFSYDEHNTYYKLPDLRFILQMDAPLRRYLEYAFSRSSRVDFLRALEVDGPPLDEGLLAKEHYVWETAVWICVSGRKLVKRADGTHRLIPAEQVLPTDTVLPNELRPCTVTVRDDGIYEYRETAGPSNFSVYYRGDPARTRLPSARHYRHCISRSGRTYRVTDVSDRDWLRRLLNSVSWKFIHFDLHPNKSDTVLGRDVSEENIRAFLRRVRPDFIQYDCVGVPGYSGYPTKVGWPAPGIVKDSLAVWRKVTREERVALLIHYCVLWNQAAVEHHPDWAVVNANGERDKQVLSIFSPFAEQLLIPQLKEAATLYDLDGAWMDADGWVARLDYSPAALAEWKRQTGQDIAPKSRQEAGLGTSGRCFIAGNSRSICGDTWTRFTRTARSSSSRATGCIRSSTASGRWAARSITCPAITRSTTPRTKPAPRPAISPATANRGTCWRGASTNTG